MSSKISKSDKINYISMFFAEQGKKMTNLTKVKVDKLDEIIKQYKIDLEIYRKKEIEYKLKQEQEELEREREREEKRRLKKEDDERWCSKWNTLKECQKLECYKFLWEKKCKNNQEENERNKRLTDIFYNDFKKEGANVERTGDNKLIINGINLINGFEKKINSFEEDLIIMSELEQQIYTYTDDDVKVMIDKLIKNNTDDEEVIIIPKKIKKPKSVKKIKFIIIDSDTEDETL